MLKGKGTRDWTPEQQKDLSERGKAYDDDGKAFEGHHMKSAEKYPEYQGEPDNIQFLTRSEHLAAHNSFFQNPTNGYYHPITGEIKDFGLNKYEPCEIIELSTPISIISGPMPSSTDGTAKAINDDNNTDANINCVKNVSDTIKNIDAKKLTTNIPKQSSYLEQPISSQNNGEFRRFIGRAKNIIGKAVNYAIKNPRKVIGGIATFAGGVEVVLATKNLGDGNSSGNNSDYTPSTDAYWNNYFQEESDNDIDEYSENDTVFDESLDQTERASPREHSVSGYDRQQNGKTVHVNPYTRGKKKDD